MGLHLSVTHTHTHVMTRLSIWIAAWPSFFLLISSFHRWRFWWFCAFGCDKTRFPLSGADFTKAILQWVDSFFFCRQTFSIFVCLPAACLRSGSSVTPLVDVSALRSCQEPLWYTAVFWVHCWGCLQSAQGCFCPGFAGQSVKNPGAVA